MIDLFGELTGETQETEIIEVTGEEFYGPGYEDSDRLVPDISKLRTLGWEPRLDAYSTFREAMTHYLARSDAQILTQAARG
jgi:UDP-apiose/xylose synthase